MDSANQRLKEIDEKTKAVVDGLKSLVPGIEITDSKCPEFFYYTASVVKSKIVVQKNSRRIYTKDVPENLIKEKYFTADEAKAAINNVLPEAEKKFKECLNAYLELQKSMDFGVGFSYDGDTHGIYDEHYYVSFKMEGFEFNFEIEH